MHSNSLTYNIINTYNYIYALLPMLRLFNVYFTALFLANSVLHTLFLYAARDEKNETKFFTVLFLASRKNKIYKSSLSLF